MEFGIETIIFVLITDTIETPSIAVAVSYRMGPEDEYDIKESFHVMDEEKTGEINVDQLETLCLGLGYNVEREELERSIQQTFTHKDSITVDIVLAIMSQVRMFV